MRDSKFVFESVDLLYYSLHKTNLKRAGSSYVESYELIRNKRATINAKSYNDNNCYQYSITASLNHQNIRNHPSEISKIKPLINKYNWKDIDFQSGPKHWKKFEQNNKTIALNILFALHKTKKIIRIAYKSNYNRERENQVVLSMITDGKKWHYLALKRRPTIDGDNCLLRSLSKLVRGVSSNHVGDYYCLNFFHSKSTDNAFKNMKDCVVITITVK